MRTKNKSDYGKIVITEDKIIRSIVALVTECDCDTLARIAGELFGGRCKYLSEDEYGFYPTASYGGEFGKVKT